MTVLAAHIHRLASYDYKHNFEYGWYPYEKWGSGPMRWTWKRARFVEKAKTDIFGIAVFNHPSMPAGLTLKLSLDGKEFDTIHLGKGITRGLYYHVPGVMGRKIAIDLDIGRTFNPYREGLGNDFRDLGVAVSPLVFLEIPPPEGMGLYNWEEWDAPEDWMKPNFPARFRWTGRRATLPKDQLSGDGDIYVKLLHPDIRDRPVTLTILGDKDILLAKVIRDNQWLSLSSIKEYLPSNNLITMAVSRTWNPKEYGVSEDCRDLGVALMIY